MRPCSLVLEGWGMNERRLDKGFYSCPPLLERLIQLVNELATGDEEAMEHAAIDAELERRSQIEIKYAYVHYGPTSEEIVDEWDDLQEKLNSEFIEVAKSVIRSRKVIDFLIESESEYLSSNTASRYHNLYDIRDVLHAFADNNAAERPLPSQFETNYPSPVCLTVDQKGLIKPRINGVVKLFADHDVYAENIRRCPVCTKIYWRRTRRSRACSKACSNVQINREYRWTKREAINARRRETYKSKQEQLKARGNANTKS
jgi:hypothetical protein